MKRKDTTMYGVEARGNSVRIYFRYDGELCREPVPGGNTEANRAHAKRLVDMIEYEIQAGIFDYSRHFPTSSRLEENTFGHYLELWLSIQKNNVAASTYRGYANKAEVHVKPRWGEEQIDKIDHLDLQQWVQGTLSARLKNKTIRDIVSNVRQVFKLYRTRKRVAHDPTEGLLVRLPDPAVPDPFTRAEIEQIMATPTNRTLELLMVQFMIWAGPRVSETLALAWEDVDLQTGTVTFRRSKVRGEYRVTKTRRSTRKVRLIKPALEALQKLRALIQKPLPHYVDIVERDNRTVRQHKLHFVFLNTSSGEPHVSDFTIRDRFFKTHLEHAGVRYRGPGQCRHTYASQMLSSGVASIDWIAEQMGHTDGNMIRKHYGTWINEDGPDVIGMLEHALKL
ncbi:Prophage PssSM-01, integrase protein [Pseudomonas syringae pv. tagetis]|uniref:Prophage PssSM-01, integrase protein n=2 Tax=Pseudomonas syringae group TaxID=136849 RepID=A0A3M3YZP6_9PSED|nr:Prophage PssSM-01, integrase protein [Pseudomonas syringae pv. tagetis]